MLRIKNIKDTKITLVRIGKPLILDAKMSLLIIYDKTRSIYYKKDGT